jgi:beta-alanine degradation protein BauB
MAWRLVCAFVFCCMFFTSARAQDPTKVEPTHYRLVFENERVQVVSVHYGPHEKSEMHQHPGGVVVIVTGGHLKFTDQNGKVTDVYAKAGEARWFPPFKHKVENVGDEPYNAVYVGIKGKVTEVGKDLKPGAMVSDSELARVLAMSSGSR